jgi:predicted ATPase/DNA-binding SARP family transcriptional activator
MPRFSLSLLGTFNLTRDENPVGGFGSDKVRALLAYLAVQPEQPHRREKLAALLWSEQSEERARANLSQALYNLHQLLGQDCLKVTSQTIQIQPIDLKVDVIEFERLLSGCSTHFLRRSSTCPACIQNVEQAVRRYRGNFLEGLTLRREDEFEEWTASERENLCRKVLKALLELAVSYELRGDLTSALPYAQRAAGLDLYNEEAQRLLLRLLALSGEHNAARAQYERLRQQLAQVMGVEPEPETQALYNQLYAQLKGVPLPPSHLPTSLNPFIGRQSELTKLRGMLRESANRLISLVGPGGCGKTRLALEAARGLQEHFTHGVYFISLSDHLPDNPLWPVLADAMHLQMREKLDPEQQIRDYLHAKSILLIFDSFETALEKAVWLDELLQYSPQLTALVTSRICLEISGEQIFTLGGMSVPELGEIERAEQFDAVQLLVSFIRHRQPGFALNNSSRNAVQRICHLLQGYPLGLLLASAWVGFYSLEEIASQIESNLDFLSVNWSNLPERQRSLRATFDYSWKLLEENEKAVFRALCIFRGEFTRQAAQGVSEANPQEIRCLLDKSLVMLREGEWYAIHALLRQYGLEKLSMLPPASQAVSQRYSAYYLEKLEQWEAGLKGSQQEGTLAMMNSQMNDLRSAWDWACQQGEIDHLDHGLEGFCLYYELSARFKEGKSACLVAADSLDAVNTPQSDFLKARLYTWQSCFCRLLGEPEPAGQLRGKSLEIANHLAASGMDASPVLAFIYFEAGEALFAADLKLAREQLQRSVELYRKNSDHYRLARSLGALGINLQHSGSYTEAIEPLTECIATRRAFGDRRGLAKALANLAFTYIRIGQFEKCASLLDESQAIAQSIGDTASIADELMWMARLLIWQGRFEDSFPLIERLLPLYYDLGDRFNCTFGYMILGLAKMLAGKYEPVNSLTQKILEIGEKNGFIREIALSHWILGGTALAEGRVQEAFVEVQKCVDLYRKTGHQDELGWALSVLANIYFIQGQNQRANIALVEALQIAANTKANHAIMHALATTALILAHEGQVVKALELYARVKEDPIWNVSPWMERVVGQHIVAASAELSQEVITAAREQGRQRDHLATINEMLVEFSYRCRWQ